MRLVGGRDPVAPSQDATAKVAPGAANSEQAVEGFVTEHQQPAGWYPSPDPDRRSRFARYWDGERWTSHEIAIDSSPDAPVRRAEPTEPAPGATGGKDATTREAEASRGGMARRLAWLPKLAIVVTLGVLTSLFVIDLLDADGPIGYSLQNDSTSINPLVNEPQLRVTTGQQTKDARVAQTRGGLARIVGATWSLDETVTIEFVPAFPSEDGHTFVIDLRKDGANALSQNWFLRVDIVATNSTFEIEVSQPVSSGFVRRREVTQRVTLPRSNERMLAAALEAQREREAAARRAADEARREVQRARSECVREESAARRTAVAPIIDLQSLFQGALDRRRIYTGESMTFDEYRRRINNLVSDMQGHLRDAERTLGSEPQPSTGEFARVVQDYSSLRQAWVDFERALRSPRPSPGRTFHELYPVESGAVELWQDRVRSSALAASGAASRVIGDETRGLCETRHPLP